MPSVELGVCMENFIISLKHRAPGRLLLNVPVSEEFYGKPGSFGDLPCPGSHWCQKCGPTPLFCFSPLPLSCRVSAQLPAFCWPDHPLANPAEDSSPSSVCSRDGKKDSRRFGWQGWSKGDFSLSRAAQGLSCPSVSCACRHS